MAEFKLPQKQNWRAIKELGIGGQGKVYLAIDNDLANTWQRTFMQAFRIIAGGITMADQLEGKINELFQTIGSRLDGTWTRYGALKILHSETEKGSPSTKAKQRLLAELQALKSNSHPNLIKILAFDPEATWVVYEYFKSGTLLDKTGVFKGRALETVDAILPLVDAVAELHKEGFVHRDIKPGNVFVGEENKLILGDLGLIFSTLSQDIRITSTNEKVGTTHWMPTWCIGDIRWEDVKPSFDVFALAKLLWSLIAGDWALQLHYYSRDKYDLCKRFPDDPSMQKVNESLAKCLVEFETSCLPSAAELLVELRLLRSTLNRGVNKVNRGASKTRGRSITKSTNVKKKDKVQTLDISAGATGTAFDDQVHIVFYKSLWGAEKYYEAHVAIDVGHLPRKEEQCAIPGSKLISGNFEFRFLDVLDDRIRVTVRQIN